jgi:uncharacterized protein (TIGR01777 family)
MKVIIAGGTGLIGRALSEKLISRGDRVIVLTRDPRRASHLPAGVAVGGWDGATEHGWNRLVDDESAIVNLAGAGIADGRWTERRKREIRDSRVDSGRAITLAVRDAPRKPRVVVQASAVGYYGPRDESVITESDRPGTDYLARLCQEWESSTVDVETYRVRRAIVRTGMVLSASGGALPRLLVPFRVFVGGPLGSGSQWISWIHVEDAARAILYLLDDDMARGSFNLVAPKPVTNREFARALAAVIGRPALVATPAFAVRALLGEMSTVVLDGQRVVPARLNEAGFIFRFPEVRTALADLLKPRQGPRGL